MRLSRYFLPFLKETPAEAQIVPCGLVQQNRSFRTAKFAACGWLVVIMALSASRAAHASLVISSDATSNVVCSKGGICMPTAVHAVLNENDLESLLASENVMVTTTGSGVQAKDLRIGVPLTWTSKRTLTLDSYHSTIIDNQVSVAGVGGLDLLTDDGGNGGILSFGKNGAIKFAHLKSKFTENGIAYLLVKSIAQLAADVAGNLSGDFALAGDYNASRDGTYTQAPIDTGLGDPFTGSFEGLGNRISNLAVSDPTAGDDGLFSVIGTNAQLRNLRLQNVDVSGTGSAGGLVAFNDGGTLFHDEATGAISGSQVGGLVGANTGTITNSSSTVGVTGIANASSAGGIAGENEGTIDRSDAGGTVVATQSSGFIGGLVGENYYGTVKDSAATGAVSTGARGEAGGLVGSTLSGSISGDRAAGTVLGGTEAFVGGLIGENYDTPVDNSFANGDVSSGDGSREGGLIGDNLGAVTKSFATGSVTGGNDETAGGLIGLNSGAVAESFATGSTTTGYETTGYALEGLGGLVGLSEPGSTIENCYSNGAVSGGKNTDVGGLVGYYYDYNLGATISYSYSTGALAGGAGSTLGGLVGYDSGGSGSISESYWDTTTSGITNLSEGVGNISDFPGVTGLTTTQLQSGLPTGFQPKIWREKHNINDGLPYLRATPPPREQN